MPQNHKKTFEDLIEALIREDGSDLHIAADRVPVLRVNGELIFLLNHPAFTQEDVAGIFEAILSSEHYKHFVEKQELDFSYNFQGTTRLRGNAFVQKGKYGMALRLIPHVKTLAELNLPIALAEFARRKRTSFDLKHGLLFLLCVEFFSKC